MKQESESSDMFPQEYAENRRADGRNQNSHAPQRTGPSE